MKQIRQIINAVKSVVSVPVYSDNVPETQGGTAIAVINLGSSSSRAVVDGRRTREFSNWRLTVVSKDDAELESVLEQIDALDNKSIAGFHKVFVTQSVLEPKGYSEPFRRAFITIRAYV